MEHDGYIDYSSPYKPTFNTTSSWDTTAAGYIANNTVMRLTVEYVSEEYAGYYATTTQEFIDCVIKACEESSSSIGYGTSLFSAHVAVKDGSSVTFDISVIEAGLKAKYPNADIFENVLMVGPIRKGYTGWTIMGGC